MASLYGIISVTDLEADGTDYSKISSKYTDSVLEEWISMAEQFVCSKLKTTFDSSASNEIKYLIKAIARQIATNQLIHDNIIGYKDQTHKDPYSLEIIGIIINNYTSSISNGYSNTNVVRIRMDGYNPNE